MRFRDLWEVLDDIHPLWINLYNGGCVYFENKNEACMERDYMRRIVKYITRDGDGVLTVELGERLI